MEIKHRYRFYKCGEKITSRNWRFTINRNGTLYIGEIEYNTGWNADESDGYFIGYLKSIHIEDKYKNTYIQFGYSDVHNNVKYILNAIKEVIEGDFSNVKGAGFYCCDISKLKTNK